MYPMLLIHPKLPVILKKLSDASIPYISLSSHEDLREILSSFIYLERSSPMAFGDMKVLSERGYSFCLKFLEETKVPVIFVSTQDALPQVVQSRFKSIRKLPDIEKNIENSPSSLLDSEEDSFYGKVRKIVKHFPSFFPVFMKLNHSSTKLVKANQVMEWLLRDASEE